ncbi:hypothetical protein QDW36_gp56 [Microbacterium phage Avocadoman]|uniref:hypothetical protein n=1 Tax=Microbacterium phage Avocadoman TaxID=2776864 RepID=UPI0018A49835|nr:hypothetical protein QDW36_gp56 [Microbacterium phage Avocadoman]QOP64884.1 hypothetical protein SEA_AVOCADOMAN_56 [Microbacterium phage Avocadoman]
MIDITKTTIPTAEQVEAFKTAWAKADAAGLEGMRTIAGLHAALNVETPVPEPKPEVYAIDEDGDRWEPVPNTDLWRCVTELDLSNRTSEDLERVYGPIEYHGLD